MEEGQCELYPSFCWLDFIECLTYVPGTSRVLGEQQGTAHRRPLSLWNPWTWSKFIWWIDSPTIVRFLLSCLLDGTSIKHLWCGVWILVMMKWIQMYKREPCKGFTSKKSMSPRRIWPSSGLTTTHVHYSVSCFYHLAPKHNFLIKHHTILSWGCILI